MLKYSKTISILVVLVFVFASSAFAFSQNKFEILGKEISGIKQNNKSALIAKVNGQEIYEADIDKDIIRGKILDSRISKKQALERKIRYLVVVQEAKEQNLVPSDETVHSFIEDLRKRISEDEVASREFASYLKGIGLTEEEYFESHFEGYKEKLTYGNLMHKIRDKAEGSHEEKNLEFEVHVDTLVNNAEIEIVENLN
ncbi:hypothetical protein P378_03010 [Desulforamulus profundi]|uniref:Peptidylprolyl isomerase n=1 Tax=Desulforamulus profundi TaxID=1383067 RepID=A0A2C6MI89_9FIRM|nr:SurA N-terminal domain-containing protein [Desulforamulus profundi]PHJ39505.1 hypothetical protein P378_03010 [Desulforamulus profundi]